MQRDHPLIHRYQALSFAEQFQRASRLAEIMHAGQPDKGSGEPYVGHPFRVHMYLVQSPLYEALEPEEQDVAVLAALLHDTIEDTPLEIGDLLALGFSNRLASVVTTLTHKKDERRHVYISRVRNDETARAVKAADIIDNTNPTRLAWFSQGDRERLTEKYAKDRQALGLEDHWAPKEEHV